MWLTASSISLFLLWEHVYSDQKMLVEYLQIGLCRNASLGCCQENSDSKIITRTKRRVPGDTAFVRKNFQHQQTVDIRLTESCCFWQKKMTVQTTTLRHSFIWHTEVTPFTRSVAFAVVVRCSLWRTGGWFGIKEDGLSCSWNLFIVVSLHGIMRR